MENFYNIPTLNPAKGAGEENLSIIRQAINIAKLSSFNGIKLPFGEYEIYSKESLKLYTDMLDGKFSPLDYDRIKDLATENIAFKLNGFEDFIFSGDNTILKFDGLIAPFDIENCKRIRLKRITIDWLHIPYFTANISSIIENSIQIMPIDSQISGNEPIVSIQNTDINSGVPGGNAVFENVSNIKNYDGKYSLSCDAAKQFATSDTLILRNIYNFAPAIHIYRSTNITLEDVTVKAAAGMGIIGQKVNNLNLYRVAVKPGKGRAMSTNTDAVHLINCSGLININTCHFESSGDDALNIHGFYHIVEKIANSRIYTKQPQNSQDYIDVVFEKDHEIEFVNSTTLIPHYKAKIINSGFDKNEDMYFIELSPDDIKHIKIGEYISSATEIAALNFENCIVKNLRGRGMLIQTRNVRVRNNLFDSCTGEAIHICTEAGWYESGSTENIEIYENRFINCGFGKTKYCDAVAVVTSTDAPIQTPGVHKGIKIFGNEVIGKNKPFLITCADEVEVINNKIACTNESEVKDSINVEIKKNKKLKYTDADYLHPAVFAVGNDYQIMQPSFGNYLFSVRVGDEIFTDEINGVMRSSCPVHCVRIPQYKLDEAKHYTIITRRVLERTHNTPPCEPTVTMRTYSFNPIPKFNPRCYYIADSHGFIKKSIDASEKFGNIDFLILNGDIQCHSDEIKDFILPFEIISALTKGEKPTLFVRGNHETIGKYAEIMNEYIPNDNGKTYFTARLSNLWFLCLDCGCDHKDDFPEYSGTMDCHSLRLKQIDFIKSVIANAKNEYDASNVSIKIVVCHVPFTNHLTGKFSEEPTIYSEWQRLISQYINPNIMISGHMHEYSIIENSEFPLIVASERMDSNFGGTGFLFSDHSVICKFTSDTSEKEEKTIVFKNK